MTKQQGMLNDTDLDKIGAMFDSRFELKVKEEIRKIVKEELGQFPTKKEYFDTMDDLMKEIKAARADLAAHKMSHENIEEDTSKLKQQVQHLFKTFEIKDPTEVAISI